LELGNKSSAAKAPNRGWGAIKKFTRI